MHHTRCGALIPLFIILGVAHTASSSPQDACQQIAGAISSASAVYYPIDYNYTQDINHYASSSSASAVCSVEPGTAQDVGIVLQILGVTQTPFGVKGGGHTMNANFSSSTGVQIAMTRFDTIDYDADAQTATLGAGLIWDDVYAALEPYGVNVVGGRVTGIGVAGFTLGGGYSWLSNQYGLALDTVQAYELVFPNGTASTITAASNPDLWFGLRGGFNNFGIVTQFTMKTFPEGQIWGGVIQIIAAFADEVNAATANFSVNGTDPKAALLTTYDYVLGNLLLTVIMFYDGPGQPEGVFDEFLAIPYLFKDVSTRSFLSLVQAAPSNLAGGFRGVYNTVPIESFTPAILAAVQNQTEFWGGQAELLDSGALTTFAAEPFLPSVLTHGAGSAYPPARGTAYLPLNINFAWVLPDADAAVHAVAQQTAAALAAVAQAEGQDLAGAPPYPNYAIAGTPIEDMYGGGTARLAALRAQYDPTGVMLLAGGWKFGA